MHLGGHAILSSTRLRFPDVPIPKNENLAGPPVTGVSPLYDPFVRVRLHILLRPISDACEKENGRLALFNPG